MIGAPLGIYRIQTMNSDVDLAPQTIWNQGIRRRNSDKSKTMTALVLLLAMAFPGDRDPKPGDVCFAKTPA